MKKILSMILALAMILSLGVTAFATNEESWTGSETLNNITIGATYSEGTATAPEKVYSVKITWTVPTITYTATADTYQWKPESLKYEKTDGDGGAWSTENTTIVTVTNRSDAVVNASVSYNDTSDSITSSATWTSQVNNEAATTYSIGTVSVPSAAVTTEGAISYTEIEKIGTEQKVVFTGTITVSAGSISENTDSIGTITVTLTKPESTT